MWICVCVYLCVCVCVEKKRARRKGRREKGALVCLCGRCDEEQKRGRERETTKERKKSEIAKTRRASVFQKRTRAKRRRRPRCGIPVHARLKDGLNSADAGDADRARLVEIPNKLIRLRVDYRVSFGHAHAK